MQVNGYVIDVKYSGDGTMFIKTRIPSIHGPMRQEEYRGQPVRNYVLDNDLPYYPATLLPSVPAYGEVVVLSDSAPGSYQFTIIGLTGGNYARTWTNIGE